MCGFGSSLTKRFSAAGGKSSRDEQVACAMLATQLDNFLGGEPVQHRQVQGYESPEFMKLFPRGVSYKVRVCVSLYLMFLFSLFPERICPISFSVSFLNPSIFICLMFNQVKLL